ncbi:fibroin heavy chain isoform X2 [Cololabis saira]|uniref:fibroin heavy chain isoform X2 n=1 Tax=Cololabis saira TaxID=129043 RepID=UPI002AD55D4E|nr:fibroin heavy chain isoform X2 [Cololabis saira]
MLLRALLQTSLILCLAQQTLQGGTKPQNVNYARMLPGPGIGVKPGGPLGALGSRYGTKAMKTGIGRYPVAHHGVGGYRSLGLGGKAALKQGGYVNQGPYGANLGAGVGLGHGLPNGLGLGHAGKRGYGNGHGTLPGYGAFPGMTYPGVRQGVSAADLGGPVMASLGQAGQHPKREQNRGLGHPYGREDKPRGLEVPGSRFGSTVPELHTRIIVERIYPDGQSPSLTPGRPHDGVAVSQAQPEHETRGLMSPEDTLAAGDVRREPPADKDKIRTLGSASTKDLDVPTQQNQKPKKCKSLCEISTGLLDKLKIRHLELVEADPERIHSLAPEPHDGEATRNLGRPNPSGQKDTIHHLPLSQGPDVGGKVFSPLHGVLSAPGLRRDPNGPATGNPDGFQIGGLENGKHGFAPVIPGETRPQSLDMTPAGEGPERFTAPDAKHHSQPEHVMRDYKALRIPGQAGRNTQAASHNGGGGNYLGANMGNGGYGPGLGQGLGQGPYLGGAAGKLGGAAGLGQGGYPHGVGGKTNGYHDGAAGFHGVAAGNGFGYGNGYGDGLGADLGYPAELADVAENKAGKSKALGNGNGAYNGHPQGGYGALGAGLDPAGGKYGGAAGQGPYGNAPMIPAGLEGDVGYPFGSQPLSLVAEGAKTASKYGAAAGYGGHQPGYGAQQLGVAHDGLGEHNGKYGMNGGHGNGYKG